jgi:hypothetical protein
MNLQLSHTTDQSVKGTRAQIGRSGKFQEAKSTSMNVCYHLAFFLRPNNLTMSLQPGVFAQTFIQNRPNRERQNPPASSNAPQRFHIPHHLPMDQQIQHLHRLIHQGSLS